MNEKLWEHAQDLAARKYDVEVLRDETTDGQPIFLARNPELSGCKAQGTTIEEALSNLIEARADYIYGLLEDGLSVPDPTPVATSTSTAAIGTITGSFSMQDVKRSTDDHATDIANNNRYLLYRASLGT
jgi:predicted RNase H-like HicB family nuclease